MQDTNNAPLAPSKPSLLNNPAVRSLVFQVALVLAIIGFGYYLVNNVLEQYAAKGINAGFDFLSKKAGFDILFEVIPFSSDDTYGRLFIVGILNTMLVAVIGIFLATILGFTMGIARLSDNWLISKVALVYVEIFRNIPVLLQILFWYVFIKGVFPHVRESWSLGDSFFLSNRGLNMPAPVFEEGFGFVLIAFALAIIGAFIYRKWAHKKQDATGQSQPVFLTMLGIIIGIPLLAFFISGSPVSLDYPVFKGFNFKGGMAFIPELAALVIALSIYTAAFIAEVVRSGINAVSSGQKEAADALGLPTKRKLSLVVIPQAMRIIIPQLTSQYLNLTKNSSLAMAIGFSDLVGVFMGTSLNQSGRAVEIVIMTMAVYLTLSIVISVFMNWYNNKMALVER